MRDLLARWFGAGPGASGGTVRRATVSLVGVSFLSACVLSACSNADRSADVQVSIVDTAASLTPAQGKSGDVSFAVDISGRAPTDLLIVLANSGPTLPLAPDGTLDTDRATVADHVGGLRRGHYYLVSPNLRPGRYLLVPATARPGAGGRSAWIPGHGAPLELVAPPVPSQRGY